MAGLLRRVLAGSAVAALALALGGAPAGAAPATDEVTPLTAGMRLVNADGDTARKCLDARTINVHVYTCNNAAYQDWNIRQGDGAPSGWYNLRTRGAVGCLEDVGYGYQGRQVQMNRDTTCNSLAAWWGRTWYGNWFQWYNYSTGMCLDVRDYGTSSVVQTWPCLNQGNQKWKWY